MASSRKRSGPNLSDAAWLEELYALIVKNLGTLLSLFNVIVIGLFLLFLAIVAFLMRLFPN